MPSRPRPSSIERSHESRFHCMSETSASGNIKGSLLEGRRLRHRDPLSYVSRELADLAHGSEDMVWIEHPAEPYSQPLRQPSFHDVSPRPVCLPDFMKPPADPRPAAFVFARSNVVLAGYRAIIGMDGEFNLDESFASPEVASAELSVLGLEEQWASELIGFEATDEPCVYTLQEAHRKVVSIDEPVICLSSDEAPNYGSFLFRMFPKLVQIARLDVRIKILVPIYFESLRQFLLLAGIDESRLLHQDLHSLYRLRRAIVPSMRNRHAWLDDETIAFYDSLRLRHGEARCDRKIYLTRRDYLQVQGASGRIMRNEQQLITGLEQRGFEILEPQKFSAVQQIRLFSSASAIVCASGSAMFNVVFSYPGTKIIDIESEPHWIANHARLFGSRQMDYGVFEGVPSDYSFVRHHVPYEVDVARLLARVDEYI
jgi:capsular polysaccharide biosynthesis protein